MDYRVLLRPDLAAMALAYVFVLAEASRALLPSPWVAAAVGGLLAGGLVGLAGDLDASAWLVLPPGLAACALLLEAARQLVLRLLRRRGTPAPRAAPRALLAPMWTGRLPLWRAGYQVLVTVAALTVVGVSLAQAPLHRHTRLVAGSIAATWLLACLAAVWLLVGVWRSAGAHVRGGGWRAWAWSARLASLLLAGTFLLVFVSEEAARATHHARLAFGPAERDSYALRLLRSGTEVELSGSLGFGAGEDLAALLARNPGVRVLHLDSPGGWVFEGRRIAELVRKRKLVTYVANRCESACVRVFAAGEERWISRRASLGLHATGGPLSTRSSRRRADSEERDYLLSRGVERSFVERGLGAPADGMWWPTREEVLRARLATRYAGPDDVALTGMPPAMLARLALFLRENLLYQTLFEFERPLFERAVVQLRTGYEVGQTEREAMGFLEYEVATLVERYLPRTSDAAARELFVGIHSAGLQLKRTDPRGCAALLAGESSTGASVGLAQVHGNLLEALARVMIDAHNAPQPIPKPAQVGRDIVWAVARAEHRYPGVAELLDEDEAPSREPERYCAGQLAVLEAILELRPRSGGRVFRFLAARDAADRAGGPAGR